MIEMRRTQLSFGDGLISEEVSDLREDWMPHADRVLADEQIVAAVYEALSRRHPNSRRRGRLGTPAEVVLRLLVLKHVRNWSYDVLEREVRANLVYRDFTRVGAAKTPDAKTMGRWGVALGPEVVKRVHDRIVEISRDTGIAAGRRMRVDTTVVETNIHHPTDSTLLGDGVRVLTRTMKKISEIAGAIGAKLRDRSRSVKLRLLEIARTTRAKGPINHAKLKQGYRRLLDSTSRVVGQAKRFSQEIANGVKRATDILQQVALEELHQELETMLPRMRQVIRQTKARIFHGNPRAKGKLLSLFEPSTEVIRKGKPSKPNEFGKMVKLQEAENQIVIDYEVYAQRPNDSDLLIPAIEIHRATAFPIAPPRAQSANANRRSVGSATARNGVPDLRAASASSRLRVPIDSALRNTNFAPGSSLAWLRPHGSSHQSTVGADRGSRRPSPCAWEQLPRALASPELKEIHLTV